MIISTKSIDLPLTVRDLTAEDLPALAWSGSPLHLKSIADMLDRPEAVDYLIVCTPAGGSVGKGAINFEQRPGAGLLLQFSVRTELRSLGIGSLLVAACEERIRSHGLHRAELDVEENNPRARALYERLGYGAYDSAPESWDQEHPDGTVYRYRTICTRMRKELPG